MQDTDYCLVCGAQSVQSNSNNNMRMQQFVLEFVLDCARMHAPSTLRLPRPARTWEPKTLQGIQGL